jgi:hypothetical protein
VGGNIKSGYEGSLTQGLRLQGVDKSWRCYNPDLDAIVEFEKARLWLSFSPLFQNR